MNAFEQVEQFRGDYRCAKNAYKAARDDAKSLSLAVSARIRDNRKAAETRAEDLRKQIADTSRTATVRRVAEEELSAVTGKIYTPTKAEIAAFNAEIEKANSAIADMKSIRNQVGPALYAAREALNDARAETVGDVNSELYSRWIESTCKEFAELSKEG